MGFWKCSRGAAAAAAGWHSIQCIEVVADSRATHAYTHTQSVYNTTAIIPLSAPHPVWRLLLVA